MKSADEAVHRARPHANTCIGDNADHRVTLVIVQPTPFCNIDCTYCYLADRSDRARIEGATVERIFRQIFQLPLKQRELDVSWHAGEPTVLPPDWYEEMFALIEEEAPPGVSVRHNFQTNATALTDAWCRFLTRSDVSVGVSVDGPEEIHDACRRTRDGSGTFRRVLAGIERLRAHGVPFQVITVLTARSLAHPDELFAFYESIGPEFINFNFEEIEGSHRVSSLAAPGTIESYKRFLRRFCALLRENRKDWGIREVSAIYGRIFRNEAWENVQSVAGRILSFDCRGNLSTFSPELLTTRDPRKRDFILGNIMEAGLASLLSGEKARTIAAEIAEGIELCRSECSYFDVCGGGAPSNKLCENGSFASGETMHCRFRVQATADAILDMVRDGIAGSMNVRA